MNSTKNLTFDYFRSDKLKNLTNKQLLKLLAVALLSDGYIRKINGRTRSLSLTTVNYNLCQHDLFNFLCKKTLGKSPNIYKISRHSMVTSEFFSRTLLDKFYSLSPTYQTTPSTILGKEEYLKIKQPTLKFIKNESLDFKWLALMLYFDFDGSITPSVRLKNKKDIKKSKLYQYYQVQLEFEVNISETNPQLNKELRDLCSELGMKTITTMDKRNWSGIGGVRIYDLNSIKKFIQKDTITQVKISAKSPRFKGLTKSSLIKSIRRIITEFKLSKSFKNKKEAEIYRTFLNKRIISIITQSPMV